MYACILSICILILQQKAVAATSGYNLWAVFISVLVEATKFSFGYFVFESYTSILSHIIKVWFRCPFRECTYVNTVHRNKLVIQYVQYVEFVDLCVIVHVSKDITKKLFHSQKNNNA